MIKYRATSGKNIKQIEVKRETKHMLFFRVGSFGNKEIGKRKRGQFDNYFNTWKEAKNFLKEEMQKEILLYATQLKYAEGILQKIVSLKPERKER